MKSITEFPNFVLTQGLKNRAALTAEGKSPEEVQEALGTAHKYEGDKLKHFVNALDVAEKNADKLRRVLVISLAEGESVPAKGVKVEETTYVPEFLVEPKKAAAPGRDSKGGRGGKPGGNRGGGRDNDKSSPWGLSPEQIAAKKGGAAKAAKPATK